MSRNLRSLGSSLKNCFILNCKRIPCSGWTNCHLLEINRMICTRNVFRNKLRRVNWLRKTLLCFVLNWYCFVTLFRVDFSESHITKATAYLQIHSNCHRIGLSCASTCFFLKTKSNRRFGDAYVFNLFFSRESSTSE